MAEPMVTVIVPSVPERRALLPRAVRSIVGTSYAPLEIIVVLSGLGPDMAPLVLSSQASPVVLRVLRMARRLSQAAAKNIGMELASGSWVSFVDDDDELLSCKFDVLLRASVSEPTAGVVAGDTTIVDDDGSAQLIARAPMPEHFPRVLSAEDGRRLAHENWIHGNAVIVRREVAKMVRFREDAGARDDWDFVVRCHRRTPILFTGEPVCTWDRRRSPARGASITDRYLSDAEYQARTLSYFCGEHGDLLK